MRSSNYKHSNQLNHARTNTRRSDRRANAKKNSKKVSKFGSLTVTAFIIFAAVVVPAFALIQSVNAASSEKNSILSIGGSKVFSDVIADSDITETKPAVKVKTVSRDIIKPVSASAEKTTEVKAPKTKALIASAKADASYSPKHISLSSYDRAKLERLVMGEAGGLGVKGAALVAQTIRDTMQLEKNNSIDYIINEYQYEGSTEKEPNAAVKKAVSYIFDKDGYAVQHRLIYFYASDLIESEWHETQDYIVSCGAERFFDRRS